MSDSRCAMICRHCRGIYTTFPSRMTCPRCDSDQFHCIGITTKRPITGDDVRPQLEPEVRRLVEGA